MRLTPKLPPGRASRKALRYGAEVRRLRAEGHTLESIREALLDVGVNVSVSTVRREVARRPTPWELDHAQEATLRQGEPEVPVDAPPGLERREVSDRRVPFKLIASMLQALHTLRRRWRLR